MIDYYRKYLTVTLPDGTKQQLQFYGHTEREATRKRDRAKAEYEAGLLVLGPKTTVAQYARVLEAELKAASDKTRLRKLLIEPIGYLLLSEVKASHIRAIFRLLEGQSTSSITKGVALVRRLFRQAVADCLILRDPTLNISRPQAAETPGHRSMTEQEEDIFLSLLRERVADGQHAYDIAFGLQYACGLRPSEVRALQRSDLHLSADPCVSITKACKGKGTQIGPPKTKAGVRDVPIPAWFVPLLEAGISRDGLFAVPAPGGKAMTYACLRSRWDWLYREMHRRAGAKLYRNKIIVSPLPTDLTQYCLRHTYCTNLAYAGVREVVAMAWLGHDDPDMVRKVYADAENAKLKRRSVSILNAAVTVK